MVFMTDNHESGLAISHKADDDGEAIILHDY